MLNPHIYIYIYIYIYGGWALWWSNLYHIFITHITSVISKKYIYGGAYGVMVIIIENGHGDTSSNPGRDWLHFI